MPPFILEHHVDSFQDLQDRSLAFDHIITDPPYSEHCQANMMSGTTFKQYVDGKLAKEGGVPKVSMKFDALTHYGFAEDFVRVARRWAISFCTVEDLGRFDMVLGRKRFIRSCIFYKPNSMGQLTGDRPAAAYEGIAVMHREGKKRWNGRGSYGIWRCNGTRGVKDRHPNQKPLDLCLMLVAKFTDRGETIFDPFCGSSSIGEAALLLGRDYVGWDNDEKWLERSKARLSEAEKKYGSYDEEAAKKLCSMKVSEEK